MQQRLRLGQIGQSQPRDGAFDRAVLAQSHRPGFESAEDAVARARRIGVDENEIDGDALQRHVAREDREILRARLEGGGEVARLDGGLRHIFRNVGGDAWEVAARDESAAQDHMRREFLHRQRAQHGVEIMQPRREGGHERSHAPDIGRLERRSLDVERPIVPGDAHIGQRLLDAKGAQGAIDQKHRVEVAVRDVPYAPMARFASQPLRERGKAREPSPHARLVEHLIFRHVTPRRRRRVPTQQSVYNFIDGCLRRLRAFLPFWDKFAWPPCVVNRPRVPLDRANALKKRRPPDSSRGTPVRTDRTLSKLTMKAELKDWFHAPRSRRLRPRFAMTVFSLPFVPPLCATFEPGRAAS
jgi:hypothetical protein